MIILTYRKGVVVVEGRAGEVCDSLVVVEILGNVFGNFDASEMGDFEMWLERFGNAGNLCRTFGVEHSRSFVHVGGVQSILDIAKNR